MHLSSVYNVRLVTSVAVKLHIIAKDVVVPSTSHL